MAAAATLEDVRGFWQQHPVGEAALTGQNTAYDYFRTFDNLRESPDVEPYAFSNLIHDYEGASGLRVLDYGCGNGYVLGHYARHGAEVFGVDITARAIDLTKRRFELLELTGDFRQGDGATIPVEDESIDIACSMGVLHHVTDPQPLVDELFRVLRPGGRLIAMFYNRRSFRYHVTFRYRQRFGPPGVRSRPLQEIVNMNDGPECPWAEAYTHQELKTLFRRFEHHSFTVAKLSREELVQWSPRLGAIARRTIPEVAVRALACRMGWNLYYRGTKPALS